MDETDPFETSGYAEMMDAVYWERRALRAEERVKVLEEALRAAANNLAAGDKFYSCPGLHEAAQLARKALEPKHD